MILFSKQITKALIRLCGCPGWSAPLLFATPEDRFSGVEAHVTLTKEGLSVKTIMVIQLGDITLFKIFIWGGISSDIQSEIKFYGDARGEP